MPFPATRRAFLVQIAAAALFSRRTFAGEDRLGSESALKTEVPLEDLLPTLEAGIAETMISLNVPGLSLALIRDAEIAWTKGFGIRDTATNATVDDATVFEAASLTKPVLAYAALALCEQGKLELDRPLAEFLPEPFTAEQPELLAKVTARHVLTHTTGFPNWRSPGRPLKFLRPPGEKFSYSGEGFVYLQRVVEQVSDQPLDRLLARRLFEPLGMSSASLIWKEAYDDSLARGYLPRANSRGMRRKWTEPNAASSLVCTAADYARFVCALLSAPKADDRLLLTDVSQMWKPQVEVTDGISWGLGIGSEHTPAGDACWHWGNNGSRYNCFVVAFPQQRIGLVVFTNSGNGLKACVDIVPAAIGGDHPALRWKMVVR